MTAGDKMLTMTPALLVVNTGEDEILIGLTRVQWDELRQTKVIIEVELPEPASRVSIIYAETTMDLYRHCTEDLGLTIELPPVEGTVN